MTDVYRWGVLCIIPLLTSPQPGQPFEVPEKDRVSDSIFQASLAKLAC